MKVSIVFFCLTVYSKTSIKALDEGGYRLVTYAGEIAALATAFCWALSVVFFRQLGDRFTPLSLNLWKGGLSVLGLAIVLQFISFSIPNTADVYWLLASGIIGIGIGDTAFFAALNRMGERYTLLVAETLAPVFTALLAVVWMAEVLSATQWAAIAVILIGVDIVLGSRKSRKINREFTPGSLSYAALAALCQAIGAVIGRDILVQSEVDPVLASFIRLVGGLFLVIVLLLSTKGSWNPRKGMDKSLWGTLILATFIGTFIAMMLQTFSFAHTEAAIVQSLFASSIIFSLVIACIQGTKISKNAVIGSLISITGVTLIFIS
jgi:drug/metabolite transporter (DMT)-like permease